MANRAVYQMSARQILMLAFAAAVIAVGATALLFTVKDSWGLTGSTAITFAEGTPEGISDPSTVTDEQNSIEVYRTVSPGVAFINTTSVRQDFWGGAQEGKGNGSPGSVQAPNNSSSSITFNYNPKELTVKKPASPARKK